MLLGVKSPEEQRMLAEYIIRQHSTVRAAEKLVQEHIARQGSTDAGPGSRTNAAARALGPRSRNCPPRCSICQNRLREHLATHVALRHGEKKGCIEIEYYGNDDLQRILVFLGLDTGEKST